MHTNMLKLSQEMVAVPGRVQQCNVLLMFCPITGSSTAASSVIEAVLFCVRIINCMVWVGILCWPGGWPRVNGRIRAASVVIHME